MLYKDDGVYPLKPVETFLCDITVIALTKEQTLKLKSGQTLDSTDLTPFENIAAACFENKLIALVGTKENQVFPIRVFNL